MANAKHLSSPAGLIQIIHLVFGAVAIGCGAASYESQFFNERFFFWSVVALLIVSVLLIVTLVITGNPAVRILCSGIHVIGGILLLVAGTLMILSVKHIDNELCYPNPWNADCDLDKPTKLAAASFAIINGIFYLAASALIMMVKAEDEGGNTIQGYETKKFSRPATQ